MVELEHTRALLEHLGLQTNSSAATGRSVGVLPPGSAELCMPPQGADFL